MGEIRRVAGLGRPFLANSVQLDRAALDPIGAGRLAQKRCAFDRDLAGASESDAGFAAAESKCRARRKGRGCVRRTSRRRRRRTWTGAGGSTRPTRSGRARSASSKRRIASLPASSTRTGMVLMAAIGCPAVFPQKSTSGSPCRLSPTMPRTALGKRLLRGSF